MHKRFFLSFEFSCEKCSEFFPGIFQGPPNGGVSNGGVSRSGLVLPFLSFFVLFCPFLSFFVLLGLSRGFSRFVRGLSGDFPDWSFSSFSAYYQHLRGTVPKGSATQSGPFPKKVGNTRVWKHPGLASLKFFAREKKTTKNSPTSFSQKIPLFSAREDVENGDF